MADETEVFWSPGDVARHLGVSPSGLRRLAGVYAQVHGELPKDSSGTSRQWPGEAVYRLEQARALMAAGQARSIKDALLAVEKGATPSADAALALGQDGRVIEALGVVAARLEALQASNARLELEVEALRREVATSRALPEGEQGTETVTGESSGVLVRAARWLERKLRGGKG
jgi:AraC-like DNA-binding protein